MATPVITPSEVIGVVVHDDRIMKWAYFHSFLWYTVDCMHRTLGRYIRFSGRLFFVQRARRSTRTLSIVP